MTMNELSTSTVPRCTGGLPILLVDHDTTSLLYLASMLEQYSYKVTTTELPSIAMSMIREQKNRFKLVMANINMEDANSRSFLRHLLKKDIPLISMSSERSENVARKAIAYGACLHLEKPISLNDLKYLWQHAFRNHEHHMKGTISFGIDHFSGIDMTNDIPEGMNKKYVNEADDVDILEANCIMESKKTRTQQMLAIENLKHGDYEKMANTKRSYDDDKEEMMRKDKKCTPNTEPTPDSEKRETTDQEGGKDKKKSRLVWNQELHHKFTAAVSALGDKHARPKLILKMMNEPNLTHRQVASHLQKYKAQVQRISTASISNLSSVSNASINIHGKVGMFYTLQRNKSVLSDLGHKGSQFPIRDTYQYPNLPLPLPQESTAPISSLYQNQVQFPNVPQGIHQNLHVTLHLLNPTEQPQISMLPNKPQYVHPTAAAGVSLNQSQVLGSSTDETPRVEEQCAAMPNAEIIGGNYVEVDHSTISDAATSQLHSENQNKGYSPELAVLLKVLDEEVAADECRSGSCIKPHPAEVDQFCEWLKEAIYAGKPR